MKRLFSVLLVLSLFCFATAPAAAERFSSVGQLQRFLMNRSPDDIMASGPHYVETEGQILEIHWCGANNHYQMTLQVEDSSAMAPIGAEGPQLIVHFRLHLETLPFSVGDTVAVSGTLNEMYSSVMIPWVLAETINESGDF